MTLMMKMMIIRKNDLSKDEEEGQGSCDDDEGVGEDVEDEGGRPSQPRVC